MNADMLEAIELGKKALAAKNQRDSEARIQAERARQAQQAEAWAPWAEALEKELPAWATEFIPGPPAEGGVSKYHQTMVMQLPIGDLLFTGMRTPSDEIRWDEINVRIDYGSWENAGRDFYLALGRLAQMKEYQESLRLQWEQEEAEAEAAAAVEQLAPEPAKVEPLDRIAAVLERLADAVEDIAAVAITLDRVLETAETNMSEDPRVWGWGEEEGEK